MKTGICDLPLHGGNAPRWLFTRMVKLSKEIIKAIVWDKGPNELLNRLSDPYWFQALGCILGFDWHSSGLTTTACGAMKLAIRGIEKDLGIYISGGKGKVSRQTPYEINSKATSIALDPKPLIYASRMSAKVDSACVQDGYQIYQHTFIFTNNNQWAVIQQGMNESNKYARRYHWLGSSITSFVNEPHSAICGNKKENEILNMVAKQSEKSREMSTQISKEHPDKLIREINNVKTLVLPKRHEVLINDIDSKRFKKILVKTYENHPENFEKLLGLEGIGPKTIRALALLSELLYGIKPSFDDPVRYSFAHGGKDGHPYPVNRNIYDKSISYLESALLSAKLGHTEKLSALRKLQIMFRS